MMPVTETQLPGTRVIIMGAGPAGLIAAYELGKHDVPITVLEKDEHYVGGIARTVEHHGYRFDIGGHRFFSKNQEIEDLWTEILGDQMQVNGRLSRIYYQGKYFDYPLRAANALRGLGPVETVRCMSSYLWARLHPVRNPRNLEDWVSNQFGSRLFNIFFKTYTEKVWGIPTKDLSADWAAQRIKGLDMLSVIKSALLPKRRPRDRGQVIKTLIDEFRYPRLGPGQMWERVRDQLAERGQPVRFGQEVDRVSWESGRVTAVHTRRGESFEGTDYVSTLPIRELVNALDPEPPAAVKSAANALGYRDFLTVAMVVDKPDLFPDNWIYIHDPDVRVGRIQNFKAWSKDMVADQSRCCLGLEYFCFEGDGLWTSTDEELIELGKRELAQLGMVDPADVVDGAVVRMQKAYPVYDDTYQLHLKVIREWLTRELPNLGLCGRNGLHKYNNQDHSMLTALLVARNIATGAGYDPWKVNADAEYHEEVRSDDRDGSGRQVPQRIAS